MNLPACGVEFNSFRENKGLTVSHEKSEKDPLAFNTKTANFLTSDPCNISHFHRFQLGAVSHLICLKVISLEEHPPVKYFESSLFKMRINRS